MTPHLSNPAPGCFWLGPGRAKQMARLLCRAHTQCGHCDQPPATRLWLKTELRLCSLLTHLISSHLAVHTLHTWARWVVLGCAGDAAWPFFCLDSSVPRVCIWLPTTTMYSTTYVCRYLVVLCKHSVTTPATIMILRHESTV